MVYEVKSKVTLRDAALDKVALDKAAVPQRCIGCGEESCAASCAYETPAVVNATIGDLYESR